MSQIPKLLNATLIIFGLAISGACSTETKHHFDTLIQG